MRVSVHSPLCFLRGRRAARRRRCGLQEIWVVMSISAQKRFHGHPKNPAAIHGSTPACIIHVAPYAAANGGQSAFRASPAVQRFRTPCGNRPVVLPTRPHNAPHPSAMVSFSRQVRAKAEPANCASAFCRACLGDVQGIATQLPNRPTVVRFPSRKKLGKRPTIACQ